MRYLVKPKFKNTILIKTQWGHKIDSNKSATEICWYSYQEYEVELAEGIDISECEKLKVVNLDDIKIFKSYIEADDQGGGDLHYQEWDSVKGTTEEENDRIYDNAIWELENWVSGKSTKIINCSCYFTLID